MMRLFTNILLLMVALLGLVFALLNAAPVTLDYYFSSLQAPLSLVVVLAVVAGALLGVLAMTGMVLRQRRELSRLRKSIKLAEKEIFNLRSLPLKDTH
jgi:putative membrane protein